MGRTELTDAYLAALGLERSAPTPGLLAEVIRRHVATFAFTSIGPQLGDDLPLAHASLHDRIVVRRRGGYCFEQNGLLFEVLQDLGYDCRLVLARVLLSGNRHPGLTHRITVVALDGIDHVVDVGFGAPGPHLPVPFDGTEVGSAWRRFRVVEPRAGHWHMQDQAEGEWRSLYRFELLEYGPSDCEVGHFYSHRHPKAAFVTALVASVIREDEVRSLRNRDYWVMTPEGVRQQQVVDAQGLRRLLADDFGVQVTLDEADRLFAAVEERTSTPSS